MKTLKGGLNKTEKATCIFTNGKYKWTGSANPFCLVEENLPQEEKYQPPMARSRPSTFESCPEVFGQSDYWVCDGKRCEMTCHGPNLGVHHPDKRGHGTDPGRLSGGSQGMGHF